MGILKQCLVHQGLSPELFYLNLKFAAQIGTELYDNISKHARLFYPDWFFAYALFGPDGTGELANSWDEIQNSPLGKDLIRACHGRSKQSDTELASVTCRRIAEVEVPNYIDSCIETIDWTKFRVVGFTTTFAQSLASLLLAKRIKEASPKTTIVFGGANVDAEMGVEFVRSFDWVDYVVHGEGEETFLALLSNISQRKKTTIPGISVRSNSGEVLPGHLSAKPIADMNQSPVPDYTEYFEQLEQFKLLSQSSYFLYFESSRGCWWGAKHHCTFCGLNGTTMTHRQKNPERVYTEIMEIVEKYKCTTLAATDNILPLDYFRNLLPQLSAADVDLHLFYEIKANLSREQMRALASSCIRQIQPGIESLNSRLLQMMRKGITAIQNIQFLKWCYEYDIKPYWNILYGFPGESIDDYADLPQLALSISHLYPPGNVARVIFERFSPYLEDSASFGLKLHPDPAYGQLFPPKVDLQKIAYFYLESRSLDAPDPDEYMLDSRDAITAWTRRFHNGESRCHYQKALDYVLIEDSRQLSLTDSVTTRFHRLKGKLAKIYTYCDDIRSFASICSMLSKETDEPVNEAQIETALDKLVARRLLLKEGNRYLSLAVRKKSTYYATKNIELYRDL